jgi:hypothetical protein
MLPIADSHLEKGTERAFRKYDVLHGALSGVHIAIIVYVALGWMVESRPFLFVYLLVLPMIGLQWLANGGVSIIDNLENLLRSGLWRDSRNAAQGAFLRTALAHVGVRLGATQINVLVAAAMLAAWAAAFLRMILIVPAPLS